jgi:hypothetical protein
VYSWRSAHEVARPSHYSDPAARDPYAHPYGAVSPHPIAAHRVTVNVSAEYATAPGGTRKRSDGALKIRGGIAPTRADYGVERVPRRDANFAGVRWSPAVRTWDSAGETRCRESLTETCNPPPNGYCAGHQGHERQGREKRSEPAAFRRV